MSDLDNLLDSAVESNEDFLRDLQTELLDENGLSRSLSDVKISDMMNMLPKRQTDDTNGWEFSQIDPFYKPKAFCGPSEINFDGMDIMEMDPGCRSESRVLVLYTGGTIGMRMKNGSYEPESNYLCRALRKLPMFHDPNLKCEALSQFNNLFIMPRSREGRRVVYVVNEYDPILDSSDITMDDYVHVAKDIESQYDFYDGFVILHGTDTLSYTASALSFILENLSKPVIVTGSQIPVFEIRSDGRENLLTSLMLAGHYQIPEVTVFFHEKLYRGNRTSKMSSVHFDAFDSPNYPALASLGVEVVVHSQLIRSSPDGHFRVSTNLCPDVSVLRMFPSITTQTLAAFLTPPVQGVVLQTYGAGNVPLSRKDILRLFRMATNNGVIIVNISQCWKGGVKSIYRTGSILAEYGVISGMDMTPEAALLKLAYVLGKSDWSLERRRRAMRVCLCGELTNQQPATNFSKGRRQSHDSQTPVSGSSGQSSMAYERQGIIATAMCSAARAGDVVMLTRLGTKYNCWEFPNHPWSPLEAAINANRLAAVRLLLQHTSPESSESSLNRLDPQSGQTCLLRACLNADSDPDLLTLLADAGGLIDPAPLDSSSSSAICDRVFEAVQNGEIWLLRRLHHARYGLAQIVDGDKNTLLHTAAIFNHIEIARVLTLEVAINPSFLNAAGLTAEEEADRHGHKDLALFLHSRSSLTLFYTP